MNRNDKYQAKRLAQIDRSIAIFERTLRLQTDALRTMVDCACQQTFQKSIEQTERLLAELRYSREVQIKLNPINS